MGLDNMRGSGRCPPFLVGGLIVICMLLAFNWWTMSTQNDELIKQLEHIGEQLKMCSDEQDLCIHQRSSAEGRIKNLDGEIATLRVHEEQSRAENDEIKKKVTDLNAEIKSLNKEKEEIQNAGVLCNTELESLKKLDISKDGTIATLRLEKERFSTQLEERKQETQKLRVETEQLKAELKAKEALDRAGMKIPSPKNAPGFIPHSGDLKTMDKNQVLVQPVGFSGITVRRGPILPQDPPNAIRPKPLYSVTYLDKGVIPALPEAAVPVDNHEHAQAQDAQAQDKAENEENNAGERGDETNNENEADGQLEEAERMEEANDMGAEETPKKSHIDVIANRI